MHCPAITSPTSTPIGISIWLVCQSFSLALEVDVKSVRNGVKPYFSYFNEFQSTLNLAMNESQFWKILLQQMYHFGGNS